MTAMNCMKGQGTKQLLKLLSSLQAEKNEGQDQKETSQDDDRRSPNVGKSSLINRLTGRKRAQRRRQAGGKLGKQASSGERHAAP